MIKKTQKNLEFRHVRVILITCVLSGKHTYTHASTGVQKISRHADAFKAAVIIDAESVEADVPDQTLVLVCERMEAVC